MARVVQGGQFVAMKTVAIAGQEVGHDCGERDVEKNGGVTHPETWRGRASVGTATHGDCILQITCHPREIPCRRRPLAKRGVRLCSSERTSYKKRKCSANDIAGVDGSWKAASPLQ